MPSKDRLGDWQAQKGKGKSVQQEVTIPLVRQDSTDRYLEKVDEISGSVDILSSKVAALKQIHEKIAVSVGISDYDHEDEERVVSEISAITLNIRRSMKELKERMEKAQSKNPTAFRIRKSQYTALSRRILDTTMDFNREQTEQRARLKARMRRQLEIADLEGKPKTDEEVEALLETHNVMMFTQGIVADSQKARDALADVEARHLDILALEKSVREVAELFQELAAYIDQQSELIDRVEYNMDLAASHTAAGKVEISGALASQKRRRKCIVIGLCILVVVLIIIAISLAIQFG